MTRGNALVVYMEPTSYTVPLLDRLRSRWPGDIDVAYIGENLSQQWGGEWGTHHGTVLPSSVVRALAQVWRRIRSGKYSVVHLAGWGHPVLMTSLLCAGLTGIATTVESDTQQPEQTPSWKRLVKSLAFPLLFRIPAAFLPGGSRQASYLRTFGVEDGRMTVARMTVDTVRISAARDALGPIERERERAALGIPPRATVFLYVGRLEDYKGSRILLEAFERLPATDTVAPTLLVVGDGSLSGVVADATKRSDRIIATGRLSGDSLLRAYGAADVFVLPSLRDSWGLVVNEAMASGLPVIATDRVGCVDDLVIEDRTGHVVESGSVEQLAAAMGSLMSDRPKRERLARGARDLIADWTLEAEANVIVQVWAKVLGSKAPPLPAANEGTPSK